MKISTAEIKRPYHVAVDKLIPPSRIPATTSGRSRPISRKTRPFSRKTKLCQKFHPLKRELLSMKRIFRLLKYKPPDTTAITPDAPTSSAARYMISE